MATTRRYYDPTQVPYSVPVELRSYLDEELSLVALAINALINRSNDHGGLSQIGGQALAITGTPQKLPFGSSLPNRDVDTDVANDEIIVASDGNYMLTFVVNAALSSSVVMTFEPYINGTPSGRPALFEIIQQAEGASFAASSIITATAGDRLSMWVSGTPNRTVTFDNVNYYVVRL